MADFLPTPTRTALINVDMQNCFVEGGPLASPDGLAVVERVNQLAEACRRAGIFVVHTRSWMRPDGSNLGVMGEIVPPFIVGLYTEGSPTAELHSSLQVEAGDIVVNKPRYGAFYSTDLELILRARGIDTVIVTGIATNICCETTAREAAVRDFRVFFLSDGTATMDMNGVTALDLQRATCASLGQVFAQVLPVATMIEKIEEATPQAERSSEVPVTAYRPLAEAATGSPTR
jgi:nicotinamidase-related amidase